MKKVFSFIIKFRLFFLIFWGVLIIASAILIPKVKINYDSTKYLPSDTKIKESLTIMEEEFGLTGQAAILIGDVDIDEAIRYKNHLKKIDGVMEIIWLDSFVEKDVLVNIEEELNKIDPNKVFDLGSIPGLNQFYKNRNALFQVVFTESEYSIKVGNAVEEIRDFLKLIDKPFAMSGTAVSTYYTRVLTTQEVFKITLYVIPIILIILIIFTSSWVEPFLFILSVGTSVLVNMGTNIIFPSISFLTNSTASLLQLAISMDYSIFLLHQYTKQRESGLSNTDAMKEAMSKSFLSINSSMFTTVAGFVALMFMRYTIGLDLAGVMIKGIFLSIICTFTLMPPLIIYFDSLLEKTKHRPLFPSLSGLTKYIFKVRYILPMLVILVLIPSYNAQNKNKFIYGDSAMSASEGSQPAEEIKQIEQVFGKSNTIVVLVPRDYEDNKYEIKMINDLQKELSKYKVNIQSLSTLSNIKTYIGNFDSLDPALQRFIEEFFPEDWILEQIPEDFKKQLVSDNFSRIIITINTDSESSEAFQAVQSINSVVARYYFNDYHVIGLSSSVQEIKEVVESDFKIVNFLSIFLVLLILLISFKSLTLPIILVLCIELSVWINMSIPYVTNNKLIFIGYMIVSAVQLGATIDYGILLTQNYLEARKTMNKHAAFKYCITHSGNSILTSALILSSAGFALKMVSSIEGVASLGELIGRGAFLSGFFVLFLLPQVLFLLDRWIEKTTYKANFYKEEIIEVVE